MTGRISPSSPPSSEWTLARLIAVPYELISRVISVAMSVFSPEVPQQEPNRLDRFFVSSTDAGEQRFTAIFVPPDNVEEFVDEVAGGVDGGVAKQSVQLPDGKVVQVARIFLLDLNRSRTDRQQLFINGMRVQKGETEEEDAFYARAVGAIGCDPKMLVSVTNLASQNTSIDLRQVLSDSFTRRYQMPQGFSPKFDPAELSVSTSIETGEGCKIISTLTGVIKAIQKPAQSMEEETLVVPMEMVIPFAIQGTYDLFDEEITYKIDLPENALV